MNSASGLASVISSCEGIFLALLHTTGHVVHIVYREFFNPAFQMLKGARHRADRVLRFFSSSPNWDSPTPSHAIECVPPPPSSGGGEEREWGSPNSDERTDTVVFWLYMHFVVPGI
jgi:hypothetical protein